MRRARNTWPVYSTRRSARSTSIDFCSNGRRDTSSTPDRRSSLGTRRGWAASSHRAGPHLSPPAQRICTTWEVGGPFPQLSRPRLQKLAADSHGAVRVLQHLDDALRIVHMNGERDLRRASIEEMQLPPVPPEQSAA